MDNQKTFSEMLEEALERRRKAKAEGFVPQKKNHIEQGLFNYLMSSSMGRIKGNTSQ